MNKELSKEEILENWGIFDSNEAFDNANEAMQQFADQEKKKEVIAFAEWINSEKCDYFPVLDVHNWINDNADKITTKQLYDIFNKQK